MSCRIFSQSSQVRPNARTSAKPSRATTSRTAGFEISVEHLPLRPINELREGKFVAQVRRQLIGDVLAGDGHGEILRFLVTGILHAAMIFLNPSATTAARVRPCLRA
jgi:hypothetical protein